MPKNQRYCGVVFAGSLPTIGMRIELPFKNTSLFHIPSFVKNSLNVLNKYHIGFGSGVLAISFCISGIKKLGNVICDCQLGKALLTFSKPNKPAMFDRLTTGKLKLLTIDGYSVLST
jgi:hypothetical protein